MNFNVLQQNNILLEQNALIYEISIKTVKYRLIRYGVMCNQQGLIGWNLYARKGCQLKMISQFKKMIFL